MKVQFDLRPIEFIVKEQKQRSFNLVRLIAVLLLLLFVGFSSYYITVTFLEAQELSADIENLNAEISDMETSKVKLAKEIARLKEREVQVVKALEIMQTEPPTLEVLNALETNMEYGMGINNISFSQGGNASYEARMEGTAITEEQIVALTDGLVSSGLFSSVVMPNSRRDEKTGIVTFNLALRILPLGKAVAKEQGGKP